MDIEIDTKALEEPQVAESSVKDIPDQAKDANPKKRPREDDDGDDERSHPADEDDGADGANTAGDQGTEATEIADPDQPKLSKNQMRKQKRQKFREERKEERKLLRKETRHAKTARRRLEREEKAEGLAQSLGIDKAEALRKIVADEAAKSKAAHQSRGPVPVAFIIDCDFERYMRENELVSLAGQVTRSYSMNRTGVYQAHIVISSWGGKLKERFDTALKSTHQNWKGVTFVEGDFVEAGKEAWDIMTGPRGGKLCPTLGGKEEGKKQETDGKPTENGHGEAGAQESTKTVTPDAKSAAATEFSNDSVIYLSADSPNILDKLEPNTSYVIGGLVDRNREKRLCQTRAEEKGIRTAKLPIGEYMQMASRQVLATNHVVEIMSKWLETGDWGKAFMEVIPKRKGGQLKGEDGDGKAAGEEGVDGHGEEQEQADNGQEDMDTKEDAPVDAAS